MSYHANPQRSSVGARTSHTGPFDGTSTLSSPLTLTSSASHARHYGHLNARHHAFHGHLAHVHLHNHGRLPQGIEDQPF